MSSNLGIVQHAPAKRALPPMGQGLALIATLSAVFLLTLIGIGAYLWSLHVATVRAELSAVAARVAQEEDSLIGLRRDYEIRSRLLQLDRWRGQLALEPAGPSQIAHDPDTLFTLARARRMELAAHAEDERPVDLAPGHGYTQHARAELDDLIGTVPTGQVSR